MTVAVIPDQKALARIGAQVRERLSGNPDLYRFPEHRAEIYSTAPFLAPGECTHLIRLIDKFAQPSCLIDDTDWTDYRTSYSSDIDYADPVVRKLEARLSTLTGIGRSHGEYIQGQRYNRGQFFREHCDWFDTGSRYWERERCCGGQRSWTAMIYLNAVDEGGTTDFTRVSLRIPPMPGALVLWNNALPDGSPNPYTMHAARPVVRGVKYVITKWFRAHRWA